MASGPPSGGAAAAAAASGDAPPPRRWAIAIHGGAGVINTDNRQWLEETEAGLLAALDAGVQILAAGGSALDAVTAATVALEEDPRFNAGRGSVLTMGGRHELEASIMTSDKRCGSAALLTRVRNPILLARAVMERTPHVLLAGPAAEAFAAAQGLQMVEDNAWFTTEQRRVQWERWCGEHGAAPRNDDIIQKAAGGDVTTSAGGDVTTGAAGAGGGGAAANPAPTQAEGAAAAAAAPGADGNTVGVVAIDSEGRLAAATSTGGRCGKFDGRVGDTPIIGAGNWADANVAVSGTGVGEEFQRRAAAHDVAARVAYGGASLAAAMRAVVETEFAPGDGGFVGVGRGYDIEMEFNSQGMSRAAADWTGRREAAIFKAEAG